MHTHTHIQGYVDSHGRVVSPHTRRGRNQPNLNKRCPACGHTPCEANPQGWSNGVVAAETVASLRRDTPGPATEAYIAKYLGVGRTALWMRPPCDYS